VLPGLREAGPAGAAGVMHRAAAESADSAKGNAGAILAQFFHGAAAVPAAGARLTSASLAEAAARGLALARTAMAAPCEGTILTVMRAFAEELQRQAGTADLRAGFARALARSQEALRQTRRQIPALRAAGVVDAGAQGFVCLLEGIADYIERGRAVPVGAIPAELVVAGVDTSRPGPGSQCYSVECVISAGNV
ncbi:MAG: DAK2 domain-containing protein, partial [Lacunisphaera sp.]|nr:DAK2 domain-containing protein [Lacunisphaera sp.]